MKILIAHTEETVAAETARVLTLAGHKCIAAPDWDEARDRLADNEIRLVIAPADADGMELCRAIRLNDCKRYVYAMLLSPCRSLMKEAFDAGADDFISTPIDAAELLLRVRVAQRIVSLETLDMTIFAMAKLAEMRDVETGRHVDRVSLYSRALARELSKNPLLSKEIDETFVRQIHQASALHDIGKVAVPDAVLLKPTRLSAAEWAIMRSHTTLGAGALDTTMRDYPDAAFLGMTRDIVATHHERWDGTGYPHSLVGEEIPLAGRIVALADVYDALTSVRPYKPAWTHERARAKVLEESGKHFDPQIVDAFLHVEAEFIAVLRDYGDEARDESMAA
ncbi:MAG TPA: HD domain-containing protein [Tepidisphaeraceae bacterium]|nr:HD domain-containing protein [Tepidisphaeraceae bacterium]